MSTEPLSPPRVIALLAHSILVAAASTGDGGQLEILGSLGKTSSAISSYCSPRNLPAVLCLLSIPVRASGHYGKW